MHNVLLVLAMVRLYWQCTGKAMGVNRELMSEVEICQYVLDFFYSGPFPLRASSPRRADRPSARHNILNGK